MQHTNTRTVCNIQTLTHSVQHTTLTLCATHKHSVQHTTLTLCATHKHSLTLCNIQTQSYTYHITGNFCDVKFLRFWSKKKTFNFCGFFFLRIENILYYRKQQQKRCYDKQLVHITVILRSKNIFSSLESFQRLQLLNTHITQFYIIQSNSKLLQQLKKTLMLIYVIKILNIALINFIMIVNI